MEGEGETAVPSHFCAFELLLYSRVLQALLWRLAILNYPDRKIHFHSKGVAGKSRSRFVSGLRLSRVSTKPLLDVSMAGCMDDEKRPTKTILYCSSTRSHMILSGNRKCLKTSPRSPHSNRSQSNFQWVWPPQRGTLHVPPHFPWHKNEEKPFSTKVISFYLNQYIPMGEGLQWLEKPGKF